MDEIYKALPANDKTLHAVMSAGEIGGMITQRRV
jgi:hypothetical protein